MSALIDLTGKVFDRWVVLEMDAVKPRGRCQPYYWVCQCKCGTIKSIRGSALNQKGTRSCGCLAKELLAQRTKKLFTKAGSAGRAVYGRYRHHAEKANRQFEISLEEFLQITSQNCAYCGASPSRINKLKNSASGEIFVYNGMDRQDNSKGYTKENIVPCCLFCNWMKGRLSAEAFISKCRDVAIHQNEKLLKASGIKLAKSA